MQCNARYEQELSQAELELNRNFSVELNIKDYDSFGDG